MTDPPDCGYFDFDAPGGYLDWVRGLIPDYDLLQGELVAATSALDARRILDLGTGSGETARRILDAHPDAHLVGIDASAAMVRLAGRSLPVERVTLRVATLEERLPAGPFDLVVSALAIHHLGAVAKADLFRRIADVLAPAGTFVLADLVGRGDGAATDPRDRHSSIGQQLGWLREAGFSPCTTWAGLQLAVFSAAVSRDRAGR